MVTMQGGATPAPRDDRVAASVRVMITRRADRAVERVPAQTLGLDEHLVVGRPDDRLGAGDAFVPWPGDAMDPTLPRRAVRIDLLVDRVRFTLGQTFRGASGRPPAIDAWLDGRHLAADEFVAPVLDSPVGAVGDRVTLEVRRVTGTGERETVEFVVEVQYAVRAGERTVPASDRTRQTAALAVRERWWGKVRHLQAGALVDAARSLRATDDVRDALLRSVGRPSGTRVDQLVLSAVRSLFEAHRGVDARVWDGQLRALHVAELYTDDPVVPETDGAREYRRFGEVDRFVRLVERLDAARVLEP